MLQPAVLVGLISQLTGYALQDDIARAARRLQQSSCGGGVIRAAAGNKLGEPGKHHYYCYPFFHF